MTHSLFIIDDHQIARDGLKAILLGYSEYQVMGEAASGAEALQKLGTIQPEIIFVDLRLPDINGAELIEEIGKITPQSKCILLTAEPNTRDLQLAMGAGALGFLTKEIDSNEYIKALQFVTAGKKYIAQSFSHLLLDAPSNLSDREIEVVQLIAEGLPYKQIADQMGISARTVESHKNNILGKLNVGSPVEMVRKAIKLGLIKA